MEIENNKCGWQFFLGDSIPLDKLREVVTLAYLHEQVYGPVVMICTEQGYDFMVRNGLDELYIDFGICDTDDSIRGLLLHLKDSQQINNEDIINNLDNCSENIVTLYNLTKLPQSIENLIEEAIEKEAAKNSI